MGRSPLLLPVYRSRLPHSLELTAIGFAYFFIEYRNEPPQMVFPPPGPGQASPTLADGFAEIERTAERAIDDLARMVAIDTTFPRGAPPTRSAFHSATTRCCCFAPTKKADSIPACAIWPSEVCSKATFSTSM